MATFPMQTALQQARAILAERTIDLRLVLDEQLQCQNTITVIDGILVNLRADGTLANNRRQKAKSDLEARVEALNPIEARFSPGELYDALDLLNDCAAALSTGRPEIDTTLSGP